MKQITVIVAVAAVFGLVTGLPSSALAGGLDQALRQVVSTFVAADLPFLPENDQVSIVDCIIDELEILSTEDKQLLLDANFQLDEIAQNNLETLYPGLEGRVEQCHKVWARTV